MHSAGLRTRRSAAISVDETASILTLHSVDDRTPAAPPPRRSGRRTNDSSQVTSSAPSLIIQRPEPSDSASSGLRSTSPSLIIQRHDDPSRPNTAAADKQSSTAATDKQKGSRRKIEQLVPDYRPDMDRPHTTATEGTFLTVGTAATTTSAATEKAADTIRSRATTTETDMAVEESFKPPRFTIDLSKPPRERYDHVAPHFDAQKKSLQRLFDDLVRDMTGKKAEVGRKWAQRLLRKIPSREEQEEIEGIAQAWGVELYLLVAFNVLLDTFMGCTSGGVRVKDPPPGSAEEPAQTSRSTRGQKKSTSRSRRGRAAYQEQPEVSQDPRDDSLAPPPLEGAAATRGRMLHFRTLDWAMDPLRRIVCQYDYVLRQGGEVVARSITYFGFVGILTGVRRGLSISLNFRPMHDGSTAWKRAAFRWQQLCVVLGWRPSIASSLRDCLLPSKYNPIRLLPTLVNLERDIPCAKSTAAYLIFSDGARTTTMEKDHKTAVIRSASDFIVALNHDVADETGRNLRDGRGKALDPMTSNTTGGTSAFSSAANSRQPSPSPGPSSRQHLTPTAGVGRTGRAASDAGFTAELEQWEQNRNRNGDQGKLQQLGLGSLVDDSKCRKACVVRHWKATKTKRGGPTVRTEDVVDWMKDPALCSDETHYACIMDPANGEIVWVKRWTTPLRPSDPR